MAEERRNSIRARLGRRASSRCPDYREIRWQIADEAGSRRPAWLVQQSEHGLAMLTEREDTPQAGDQIALAATPSRPHRRPRSAVIVRVEILSAALDLVTAEYTPAQPAPRARLVACDHSAPC